MKEQNKAKARSLLSTAIIFLMLAIYNPVFADEAANSDTAPDSTNNNTQETEIETEIINENLTILSNEFYIQANTGGNITNLNTGSGTILTNKAKGQGEIINIINRNQTEYNSESDLGDLDASNENTGAGSENNSQIIYSDHIVVRNINESETENIINADINSGRNQSNNNSGHGFILSGEANLGLDMITLANTNIFGVQTVQSEALNVFENYSGDVTFTQGVSSELSQVFASASNENTGVGSENNASVEVDESIEIYNKNIALLENEVELNVVSGDNEANGNTGHGTVVSNDVNVAFNMVNFLNTNITSSNWWFSSLNVFGDWDGDVVLPQMIAQGNNLAVSANSENEETGANSENNSSAETTNSFDVDNKNEAEITNNIELNAQTGDNKTSFNTGTGSGEFGETDAETNTINLANINVTGDSWWLVIVNTFGSWEGTTIGSPSNMVVKASKNTTILSPANSGIDARNSSTGPDSDNNASVEINHSTNIENDNEATINNAIVINATTGENETKHNTGHGYVDTGDVKAASNLINIANSNIAVGNWLLAVVNVFGDWNGNVRFPDGMSGSSSNGGEALEDGENNSSASSISTDDGSDILNKEVIHVKINKEDYAKLINLIKAIANSGNNEASMNTGDATICTGESEINVNLENLINYGYIEVNTIDGSSKKVYIDTENYTELENYLQLSADTGYNTSNSNTGDGEVETSNAGGWIDLFNDANGDEVILSDNQEDSSDDTLNDSGSENNSDDSNNSSGGSSNNNPPASNSPGGSAPSGNSSNSSNSSGSSDNSSGITKGTSTILGDLNGDGKVDDYDFSILMANWGEFFTDTRADANGDGKIDDYDFSMVMGNWGKTTALACK